MAHPHRLTTSQERCRRRSTVGPREHRPSAGTGRRWGGRHRLGDRGAVRAGRAGVNVTGADLVVGTSAGSTVGAQLGSGLPLAQLWARQAEPSLQNPELASPGFSLAEWMDAIARLAEPSRSEAAATGDRGDGPGDQHPPDFAVGTTGLILRPLDHRSGQPGLPRTTASASDSPVWGHRPQPTPGRPDPRAGYRRSGPCGTNRWPGPCYRRGTVVGREENHRVPLHRAHCVVDPHAAEHGGQHRERHLRDSEDRSHERHPLLHTAPELGRADASRDRRVPAADRAAGHPCAGRRPCRSAR